MSSIDWDYIAALAGDAPMTPAHQERMRREMAAQEPPVDQDAQRSASCATSPAGLTCPAHAPGER